MNGVESLHVGTCGWYYKHWLGNFYPEDCAEKDYLNYYCKHFSTVEVNSSFYHLLKAENSETWIKTVPNDFIFALKANRYITHIKRLKEPEKTLVNFIESVKPFSEKLGPILFQLPPNFYFNPQRLEYFLKFLPENFRYVFEFRNQSWFNTETYDILKKNNIALCIYHMGNYQSPKEITADFTYMRLHGPDGIGTNKYSDEKLDEFCKDINCFLEQEKDLYCYFNNDEAGYAIQNALELKEKFNNKPNK